MMREGDRERIDAIALSIIGHHGAACCRHARRMLLARLTCHPDVMSQVAAVPELVRWGPTRWPQHWCELTRLDDGDLTGDCGVHAALVGALLEQAGQPHVRGRAAIRAGSSFTEHWRAQWRDADAATQWVDGELVNHEVVRIAGRWWDPTEARWFDGVGASLASGRVVALREEQGAWSSIDESETPADGPWR